MSTRPILGLAIPAIASLAASATAQTDPFRWHESLEEASVQARVANRPMLLDFWADWCVACNVMETEVYASSEFLQASESFVGVRIDYDRNLRIARKYKVPALPTDCLHRLVRQRDFSDLRVPGQEVLHGTPPILAPRREHLQPDKPGARPRQRKLRGTRRDGSGASRRRPVPGEQRLL